MKENIQKRGAASFIFRIIALAAAVFFFLYLVKECIYGLPSFDGAMNLQVPKMFLNSGKYKTSYDGGILFDGKIQTRIPVLLPICILWKLFGIHYETAVLVNALYILLLLYAVFAICAEQEINKKAALSLLMFMVITPYFSEFAFGIYGEIPTMALFLAAILMLMKSEKKADEKERQRLFIWSGFFYSAACLNKTVIFIALPSFIFLFMIRVFWDKSVRWKEIMRWLAAYLFPFLIAEGFHLYQTGINAYTAGWKNELLDIVQQAGVADKYEDTVNIVDKFWKHVGIFCNSFHFKPGPVVFVFLLLLLFFVWIYRFFVKKEHGFENMILLVMCSYFGWWIFISTTAMAWPRRILIGVLLLEIVICGDVNKLLLKTDKYHKAWGLLFAVTFLLFAAAMYERISQTDGRPKNQVIELAETIKEINDASDAVFYGFGWWQAPVLSFYSGVDFFDIYNMQKMPENAYLVVDEYAASLASASTIDDIRNSYALELAEKKGNNYLYKIFPWEKKNFAFISAFTEKDYERAGQSVFESSEDYAYVKGVYKYEEANDCRWAMPNVELLLQKKPGQSRLNIEAVMPAVENLTEEEPVLYIFVDGQNVCTQKVYEQGSIRISIDLSDMEIADGIKDVRLYLNARLLIDNGDVRKLAYQLKSIGFYES